MYIDRLLKKFHIIPNSEIIRFEKKISHLIKILILDQGNIKKEEKRS